MLAASSSGWPEPFPRGLTSKETSRRQSFRLPASTIFLQTLRARSNHSAALQNFLPPLGGISLGQPPIETSDDNVGCCWRKWNDGLAAEPGSPGK
eukprot:scaffold80731_cov25-Prasinocladus_malaysianus.AAC.1